MSLSRVEVAGGIEFSPREWLRREVLWASLIVPYDLQMKAWLSQAAFQQHNGNVSRRDLFNGQGEDPEAQSMAFLNQGKNIASSISSAILFRIFRTDIDYQTATPPLEIQATAIDKALCALPVNGSTPHLGDVQAYENCTRIAIQVNQTEPGQFGNRRRLLQAARIMTNLASAETASWIKSSEQNGEGSLLALVVPNGGYSRSAGPRVEMLQPIFHQIVVSEPYQALTVDR